MTCERPQLAGPRVIPSPLLSYKHEEYRRLDPVRCNKTGTKFDYYTATSVVKSHVMWQAIFFEPPIKAPNLDALSFIPFSDQLFK